MLSAEMQDVTKTNSNDVHNACRTPLWYDSDANHINRAKALFCCNATPNNAYMASVGQNPVPAGWRKNGIVTTESTASSAGNGGLADTDSVVIANNWHDDNIESGNPGESNIVNTSGDFSSGPNYLAYNDSPLIRATTNAVTLISHGGNGYMSFMFGTNKSQLFNGTVAGGAAVSPVGADTEIRNSWPPQKFAGVIGHPKSADGSYDVMGMLTGASDDIVSYVRSDQIFAKIGSASCQKIPVMSKSFGCPVQTLSNVDQVLKNASYPGGEKLIPKLFSLALNEGNYKVVGQFIKRNVEAQSHNSVGMYTVAEDGALENAKFAFTDIKKTENGVSKSVDSDVPSTAKGIGIFILSDGATIYDDYKDFKFTASNGEPARDKLEFVYNFGKAGERPANIGDDQPPSLVVLNTKTGIRTELKGKFGTSAFHMYSNLNDGNLNRTLKEEFITPATALQQVGFIDAAHKILNVGFENQPNVTCYYTTDGKCKANPPEAERRKDEYGGYLAKIGDGDFDDASFSFSMATCAESQ